MDIYWCYPNYLTQTDIFTYMLARNSNSFEIPKVRQHEWRNEKAKSQFKLKSLEGNQIQEVKLMNGESLEEFMKRNISK